MSMYMLRWEGKGWKEKDQPRVCVSILCVDAWSMWWQGAACARAGGKETLPVSLNLLQQQKAGSLRTLSMVALCPDEQGTGTFSLQMLRVRYRPQD